MSVRDTALRFVRLNTATKFLAGTATLFVLGIFIMVLAFWPVRAVYYASLDGDYFLNVSSVTAENFVRQDDDLNVNFCRSPRTRVVAYKNIRTFYLTKDNQIIALNYQRNLPDGISYDRMGADCVLLSIPPETRPNDLGKYFFCQEFEFDAHGHNKVARFCSTEYSIISPEEPKPDTISTESLTSGSLEVQ